MKNRKRVSGLTASRASILAALRSRTEPVTVEELARAEGKHHNTVREQVNWLVAHGLANRVALRSGDRGRPRWAYVDQGPREDELAHARVVGSFPWAAVDAPRMTPADAHAVGREWGAELARERGTVEAATPLEGRQELIGMLADLGYAPVASERVDRVVLHRCPMLRAPARHSEVICQVLLGMVQESLRATGHPDRGVRLVPFTDPGECLLTLEG